MCDLGMGGLEGRNNYTKEDQVEKLSNNLGKQ